jgi:hypothetical protein
MFGFSTGQNLKPSPQSHEGAKFCGKEPFILCGLVALWWETHFGLAERKSVR